MVIVWALHMVVVVVAIGDKKRFESLYAIAAVVQHGCISEVLEALRRTAEEVLSSLAFFASCSRGAASRRAGEEEVRLSP